MSVKDFFQNIVKLINAVSFGHGQKWFSKFPLTANLMAGLSVATVALPVSIAYAQMMGLSPIIGIYSCVLPMLTYALLGSSRQMIVGPDAAMCTLITAALAPWAAMQVSSASYQSLIMLLTFFTGIFCLIGWRFKLGFLANLLSRPILIGLLNGVVVIIIAGQLGNVSGIPVTGTDVVGQVSSFTASVMHPHWPTLLLTLFLFVSYFILRRLKCEGPSALILAIVAIILSMIFNFADHGIAVVGEISIEPPAFGWPEISRSEFGTLLGSSIALAFLSFSGAVRTGRSFAAKNGYELDDNRELLAIGAANLAAAFSQGFAISGADSRTAVNDAAGGKTQKVQVIAALTILFVTLILLHPIGHLPSAALGVILIISALKLADFKTLMQFRQYSLTEFLISLITTIAVVIIGVMPGIFLAVLLAIIHFLTCIARPVDYRLGVLEEDPYHLVELEYYPQAKEVDGLLIYRFEGALIFFNASYFSKRIQSLVDSSSTPIRWVVLDVSSMNEIDVTGMSVVASLRSSLMARGIVFGVTGRYEQINQWSQLRRIDLGQVPIKFFRNKKELLITYYESQHSMT